MKYLNEGEDPKFWERIGQAFTDPNKGFNVPVKIPVELDKSTRNTIVISATILSAGLILASLLMKRK